MAWDRSLNAADAPSLDVYVQRRLADGSWTAPAPVLTTSNAQTGPALAYDAQFGLGLAAVEGADSELFFTSSPDGVT